MGVKQVENRVCPGVSRVCPGYTQTHLSGGGVPIIPLGEWVAPPTAQKTRNHAGCRCIQVVRTHRDTPEKLWLR
jgi:hypothetical protein